MKSESGIGVPIICGVGVVLTSLYWGSAGAEILLTDFLVSVSIIAGMIFALRILFAREVYEARKIPNGLPRPEDELPRRKLFRVHSRVGNRLTLWNVPSRNDAEPVYWEFENLPAEVEPEKIIVCVDDLENEYLAVWKEKGVIPILSAQGRARKEKSGKSQPQTVDLDRIAERLETPAAPSG